ncbi:hypothetical protein GGI18_005543, partial [Coemansia linderi]
EVIETSPYAFREFFDDIAFALPASADKSSGEESPSAEKISISATFADAFGVEVDSLDFF